MRVVPIRAESGRYAASLVLLPDLWAGAESWAPMSGFLGHRGWEGAVLDLRGHPGGLAPRARAVAEHAARQPSAAVLVGHGAGALVALEAARHHRPAALVLVAPLTSGSVPVRRLGWRRETIVDLLTGRDPRPPQGAAARRLYGDLPPRAAAALGSEDRTTVLDVIRGRTAPPAAQAVPTLLIAAEHDPLAPVSATRPLAATLGADLRSVPGAGHWLIVDRSWQVTGGLLHRWLVQQLGEGLLELYAEAMAERDADDDQGS